MKQSVVPGARRIIFWEHAGSLWIYIRRFQYTDFKDRPFFF